MPPDVTYMKYLGLNHLEESSQRSCSVVYNQALEMCSG